MDSGKKKQKKDKLTGKKAHFGKNKHFLSMSPNIFTPLRICF